jgi:hypothetical protein
MQFLGQYDTVVVGAGVAGTIASIASARAGARTLLVEGSGILGGLITGGRLTKPTGYIAGGIFRGMVERAAELGGADPSTRHSYWGRFSGIFDAEIMYRVIVEMLDEAGVEVLLHARVTDTITQASQVKGIAVSTKSGPSLILGQTIIDASGDGDVAVMAGATFHLGREQDGKTQPMTSYVRLMHVDIPSLVAYMEAHRDDFSEIVMPEATSHDNADYAFSLHATGFTKAIRKARAEGFNWIIPKNHITLKTGLIPGEVNLNVTRVHGNALDARVLSMAELEIRKQAYCCYDFLRTYIPGFSEAVFLEVAPKLGVRETRRIQGDYTLTEHDVKHEARFADAIGLSDCAIDIHEPGGEEGLMLSVGTGYGIPYRCLLPLGLDGILTAGRCASTDHVAHASTRNTPACALMGEAAGLAAALAAQEGITVRQIDVPALQKTLRDRDIPLGVPGE